MNLKYYTYTIYLRDTFAISTNSRNSTPAVIVELEHDGITGYGEASLPPYLKENQKSVIDFIKKINLNSFNDINEIDVILDYIDNLSEGDNAAKAALDIALHDLFGKINNISVHQYLDINIQDDIYSSITIGISEESKLFQKIADASTYKFLKIKLGSDNDKRIIENIRSITQNTLFVDVNQGWKDEYFALDMIHWLTEQNIILVEQPLLKNKIKENKWLKERSPIPIIADEDVQTLDDLERIKEAYSGINIKLMKSGGIRQAHRMILRAKELKLKIMIGCMTETTCAITAASHLAPLADWVDLDGAELISNDLFRGAKIESGRLIIPESPGLGIEKILN